MKSLTIHEMAVQLAAQEEEKKHEMAVQLAAQEEEKKVVAEAKDSVVCKQKFEENYHALLTILLNSNMTYTVAEGSIFFSFSKRSIFSPFNICFAIDTNGNLSSTYKKSYSLNEVVRVLALRKAIIKATFFKFIFNIFSAAAAIAVITGFYNFEKLSAYSLFNSLLQSNLVAAILCLVFFSSFAFVFVFSIEMILNIQEIIQLARDGQVRVHELYELELL